MPPDDLGTAARMSREGAVPSTEAADSVSQELSSTCSTGPMVDAARQQPAVPSSLGRYELIERLGSGGFGEVWRGNDPQLKRSVAIKIPRPDRLRGRQQREHFLEEARKLARLREGDGVVAVYDAGEEGAFCYIVTQYIAGRSLAEAIKAGPIPRDQTLEIVARVAESLHRVHLADFVHRDVKPANILLDQHQVPYLCDFGLAVTEEQQLNETPAAMGTRMYMSPEQAQGASHLANARSDVYSLGAVLYELLVGRRPFVAKSDEEYLRQIGVREPRPLRTIDDTVPAELERICLKCLAIRPADRYATALDLATDLRAWQNKPAPARAQRWGVPALALALAGLLALGGTALIGPGGRLLSGSRPSVQTPPDKRWQNVLTQAPVIPYVDPRAIPPSWNADLHEAALQSPHDTIFQLGIIERLPCRIQLELAEFKTVSPPFYAGLFLGLRDEVLEDGSPVKRYQSLTLTPEPPAPDVQDRKQPEPTDVTWRMTRSWMDLRFLGKDLVTHLTHAPLESQGNLKIQDPLQLALTLDNEGLRLLECNQREIHRLSTPELNEQATQSDYTGPFGIYLQGGSLTVRNTRVKYESP